MKLNSAAVQITLQKCTKLTIKCTKCYLFPST